MKESKKKHIVIIIPNTHEAKQYGLKVGGAEKQILNLLPHFEQQNGVKITLITKYTEYIPHTNDLEIYNISKNSILFILSSFFLLVKIHKKSRIHILNPHILGITVVPAIMFHFFWSVPILTKISGNIKQLIETRSKSKLTRKFDQNFVKFLIKNSDYFQVLNNEIRGNLISSYNIDENKIFEISNAISIKSCEYKKPITEVKKFGFVGRIEKVKNIPTLLQAFKILSNEYPKVKLEIFGTGEEEKSILSLIEKMDLIKNITLHGFLNDTKDIYSLIDCFILPSFSEGISNSLLEAMTSGIPVIASKIPANQKVIENNLTGLLFSPSSYKELAAKMKYLINNINSANIMRTRARKHIEQHFSSEVVTKELMRSYSTILLKVMKTWQK
ncbi:glycosyltransferase [Candidatus Lokiarchaeum ossiferum]|uniref:glycosyltransferase n=1 Tax=Candidatus Lokiarchaeum ossiferum TaxID=2951803 RepID=UPI00352C03B4